MTWCDEKNCIQQTPLAVIKLKNETMAKNIEKILTSIEKIEEFIYTSPQKFSSKEEFNALKEETIKFKNNINMKIAFVSWWFIVVTSVISFFLNKYL